MAKTELGAGLLTALQQLPTSGARAVEVFRRTKAPFSACRNSRAMWRVKRPT